MHTSEHQCRSGEQSVHYTEEEMMFSLIVSPLRYSHQGHLLPGPWTTWVPGVRDQLLEPPTSALVALIAPKKSLSSRGWQINLQKFLLCSRGC